MLNGYLSLKDGMQSELVDKFSGYLKETSIANGKLKAADDKLCKEINFKLSKSGAVDKVLKSIPKTKVKALTHRPITPIAKRSLSADQMESIGDLE